MSFCSNFVCDKSCDSELGLFHDTHVLKSLDCDFGISTKPYILSNESRRENTLQTLQKTQAAANGLHIGFSCWENYDFIAARKSCGAILSDISTSVYELHEAVKEMILASKDRSEFVERFIVFLEKHPEYERENSCAESIRSELQRNGSWLSEDAAFSAIQSLYRNGRIFHLRMNLCDREGFEVISKWMQQNGLACDTFYLSNIPDWLMENQGLDAMRRVKMAINRVLNRDTLVIHASEHFREDTGMPQRVCREFPYDPVAAFHKEL